MKAYAAAGLAMLLTACTSTSEEPAPPPILTSGNNTPVTLSDADRAAVEAGVREAIPGGAGATLRTMIATPGAGRGGDAMRLRQCPLGRKAVYRNAGRRGVHDGEVGGTD